MPDLFSSPFGYFIAALLAAGGVLFLLSLQQLRRARTGPYWRMRRAAGQRGGMLFLVSLALIGIALLMGTLGGAATVVLDDLPTDTSVAGQPTQPATIDVEGTFSAFLTATALSMPTATPTSPPSATPAVSHTASATGTTIDPTQTPSPALTATATVPPATPTIPPPTPTPSDTPAFAVTPPASNVEPDASAALTLVGLSDSLPDDLTQVHLVRALPAGTRRIYATVAYESLADGVTWTRVLYRDGVAVQGGVFTWSGGDSGRTFFFFGQEGGYPPGAYTLRLFIGQEAAASLDFRIGG